MKRSLAQRKQYKKTRTHATLRYILPLASALMIFILLCLPCFYFTDYSNQVRSGTSVIERMTSIWEESRQTIFASDSDAEAQYISFCKVAMASIALCSLFYIIALATSVLYAIAGLRKIYSDRAENDPIRRVFLTFIPNEIVLCAVNLISVLPALFPRIVVLLIEKLLVVYTKVTFPAGDIAIYAVIFWLATVIYLIVAKKHFAPEFSIFKTDRDQTLTVEDKMSPTDEEPSDELHRMSAASKNEQAERLRKLLGLDDEEK